MKVLIIDDNVAIQEIIKDILVDEGHLVRVASSLHEGTLKIASFEPNVIFLENKIGGITGLSVFSGAELKDVNTSMMKVVLIKSSNDKPPCDEPRLVTSIDKPFTSDDIRVAMGAVVDSIRFDDVSQVKVKRKKSEDKGSSTKSGFFGNLRKKTTVTPTTAIEGTVDFNDSYVIFENRPDYIYRFVAMFDPREYNILIVTSEKRKVMQERFSDERITLLDMSFNPKSNAIDVRALGKLTDTILFFMKDNFKPVVFIDNVNILIEENGFDATIRMLYKLLTTDVGKKRTFVVSVSDKDLSEKDKGIFLHDMKEYKIID